MGVILAVEIVGIPCGTTIGSGNFGWRTLAVGSATGMRACGAAGVSVVLGIAHEAKNGKSKKLKSLWKKKNNPETIGNKKLYGCPLICTNNSTMEHG